MYQCPNCGAGLRFDIPSQQLFCDHCGSTLDPYEAEKEKDAEEREEYDVTIFTCPQCGGVSDVHRYYGSRFLQLLRGVHRFEFPDQ